jgi:hypothetical protein
MCAPFSYALPRSVVKIVVTHDVFARVFRTLDLMLQHVRTPNAIELPVELKVQIIAKKIDLAVTA